MPRKNRHQERTSREDRMKRRYVMTIVLGIIIGAGPAQANNRAVETAIQSHPELSTFYEALRSTGVLAELKEGTDYTVFAPTNDAFVQIDAHEYPCFYSAQCRAEVAAILRNHIIGDHYTITELVKRGGNPASTIGKEDLYVEEIFKGQYKAEGQPVRDTIETSGSVVFLIDGVITHGGELDQFKTLKNPAAAGQPAAHLVPGGIPGEIAPTPAAEVVPEVVD
jgi:uncharacterized surface protein with fasciclin (FAS1) repeats